MPGTDLMLDDGGDLILGDDGDFDTTLTAQPAIRHQVLDILGDWVGDPDAGREFVRLSGNTEAELQAEADRVRKALQVLEVEGLIADIRTKTDRDAAGRWALQITCVDTASGGTITVPELVEFGD